MSQQAPSEETNLEIVRRCSSAFAAGDLDQLFAYAHPEVVFRQGENWPEGDVRGADLVRRFFEEYISTMGHSVEVEEVVQAGECVILVRYTGHTRGEQSGAQVDLDYTHVCTLRDGLVVLVEVFWDHGQARRYVGLPD
jgi:ketosteroid isomerase-like protein